MFACQPITLRPDQAALKSGAYEDWNHGRRNTLLVLPTGGGKSVIVSDIVLDFDRAARRQCVIAHRNELVSQMSMHIARRGIPHNIVGSKSTIAEIVNEHKREFGKIFYNPSARAAVAGVDTLVKRADELRQWAAQISLWTIDEAHHVLRENKWGKAAELFPNALGLGVTATPERADGKGLGRHHDGLFDAMRIGPTMRELIDAGALTEYQIVCPESDFEIDDDAIGSTGDFSPAAMKQAAQQSHIVGDVVKEYKRWANGKRGITFATDVETAQEIARQFNEAGIPAVAISAKTPSATRAEWIRHFRAGKLLQLVNVDLFGEGFDLPAIEVVSMARPTASLAVYLQQFGRALRTLPGKSFGLVIDHVSNWKRHGLPDRARYWTLDRRDKRSKRDQDPEEIELTNCRNPDCGRPYPKAQPTCHHCGMAPPLPEPRARSVEMVDGDLMMLSPEMLAELRQAAALESPGSVRDRVTATAGEAAGWHHFNKQVQRVQAQQRLDAALAQWAGIQRHLGRSDSESYRRLYLTLGVDAVTLRGGKERELSALAEKVEGWIADAAQQHGWTV